MSQKISNRHTIISWFIFKPWGIRNYIINYHNHFIVGNENLLKDYTVKRSIIWMEKLTKKIQGLKIFKYRNYKYTCQLIKSFISKIFQ